MIIPNSKQQQLTFEKGITNIPSDALCSDNTLSESIGMVYDNGEHRVIQKPKMIREEMDGKLVYIHKYGTEERYILLKGNQIWYVLPSDERFLPSEEDENVPEVFLGNPKVTSIGKSLVIADPDGLHYFLWKSDGYKQVGTLPEPKFTFHLTCQTTYSVTNSGKTNGMITREDGPIKIVTGEQENWNNCVTGLYAKNKKAITEKKAFCLPFLVRTAIELYDGSFTHISQPFLLFPCVTENTTAKEGDDWELTMRTFFSRLFFKQTQDFDGWEDIVKGLVIFASQGIEVHDINTDQPISQGSESKEVDGVYWQGIEQRSTYHHFRPTWVDPSMHSDKVWLDPMVRLEEKDIKDGITGTSTYYKICDVGREVISEWKDVGEYMEKHTLENLTTQQRIDEDDYFTRNKLKPTFIHAYNSRLNLANIARGFFEGYDDFIAWDNSSPSRWTYYVTVKTDTREYIIRHVSESTYMMQGVYFYYPDARAKEVIITNGTVTYKEKLTEHPRLNGAYFLKGLPGIDSPASPVSAVIPGAWDNDEFETLPNYIVTSEVNNPFLFRAKGYNKVSTGEIIGMSTTTMALSQDQFGQTDLLVFSTNGIWGMKVDGTGLFSSIHPTSREVCNSPQTITQTDGAVFFSSEKGLMVITDAGVRCVSEQLSGRDISFKIDDVEQTENLDNFQDFIKHGLIAYDYRDSLLWIFNADYDACYVYSIKSGTFGKFIPERRIAGVINNYPDYLLQAERGEYTLYSLLERDNINKDEDTYDTVLISRPMKLENALALKSVSQIRHIRQFVSNTYTREEESNGMQATVTRDKLKLTMYASNNLDSWVQLNSLHGTPWKYYRFRYDFTDLNAVDRFGGSVIVTQERRTNKLR